MSEKPLRLWPGVAAVALLWTFWLAVPLVMADGLLYAMGGAALCALTIVVWWLFFSRAPWLERLAALVVMIAAPFVIRPIVHRSIENAGMGNLLFFYSVPLLCTALVVWAAATRRSSALLRRVSMPLALLLGCGLL